MPEPGTTRRLLFFVCIFGTVVLHASPSLAQSGEGADEPRLDLHLRYVELQPTLDQLQREYDSIRIWAPAVGIPVSYFAAAGGGALMISGSLDLDYCFGDLPCDTVQEPRSPGQRATIGVGTVMLLGGLAGLITSAVKLRKKNKRRRELRRQIAAWN